MSKILLTEESIGQVFGIFHNNEKSGATFEIAIRNKVGYWQGYINKGNSIDTLQFDDYGVERHRKTMSLKPHKVKKVLDLSIHNVSIMTSFTKKKGAELINIEIQCYSTGNSLAFINPEELNRRCIETNGKPYFYEGEGLNE